MGDLNTWKSPGKIRLKAFSKSANDMNRRFHIAILPQLDLEWKTDPNAKCRLFAMVFWKKSIMRASCKKIRLCRGELG